LHNLGWVYSALGDKNKAKEFLEKALEMYRKTLPDNHKSIADTLHNLGLVYSDLGDKIKAKEFYEKALEIYSKTLPENHPSIKRTLNNLESLKSCSIM
jgi:tetratricopeptide (TPR) repeat protein